MIVGWLIWGLINLGRFLFFSRRGDGGSFREERRESRTGGEAEAEAVTDSPVAAGTSGAAPSASDPAIDRTVKVLMLGDTGSGKTTMLAALYHSFLFGGSTGISFKTGDRSHGRLMTYAEKIQGLDTPFPEGTRLSETWRFDVQVASREDKVTAFTIEYLDYPGVFVKNWNRSEDTVDGDVPDPEFERAMTDADALMGILDGADIRKLMRGAEDLRTLPRIDWLLSTLVRTQKQNIHLLVTKWDLVRGPNGESYQPGQVVEKLRQASGAFHNFWDDPQRGGVRIIPVAALGTNGFVTPDPSDPDVMRKVPGKRWDPWNVRVPFFCVVPDIIHQDARAAASERGAPIARISRVIFRLVEELQVPLMPMGPLVPVKIDLPVGRIVGMIGRYVHDRNRRGEAPAMLNEDTAISYVLNECFAQVQEFERDYPDCRTRWPDDRVPDVGA